MNLLVAVFRDELGGIFRADFFVKVVIEHTHRPRTARCETFGEFDAECSVWAIRDWVVVVRMRTVDPGQLRQR